MMPRSGAERLARPPVGTALEPAVAATRAGDLIFYGFMAGLAVCPFWFGSNTLGAWGFNAILFPGLVAAYEASLLASGRPRPFGLRGIALPAAAIALVVLWIALQLSTLTPADWHYPIWSMAADSLGRPVEASISVNADLTMLALLRLLTAIAVFWLALQFGHDPRNAMRILEVLAVAGAAYAAYGAISFVLAPKLLLWFPKVYYTQSVTATFVNRNSYAAYAGLGLVTCIAIAMHTFRRQVAQVGERARMKFAATIAALAGKGGYLLVCIFVISVALVLTASRGGVTASVAGVVVLGVLTGLRQSTGRIGVLVIALSLVALAAAFLAFGDLFGERLGATPELKLDDNGNDRIAVYTVTLQSILDAPWSGFGYGTFADIFPLYRNSSIGMVGTWDKAHNTYLELAQGLGIPAAIVFLAAIAMILAVCLRGALTMKRHATAPLVAVAASAIVLLHSLIDFSLQIQAVTLTWCALIGAGYAQARSGRHPSPAR